MCNTDPPPPQKKKNHLRSGQFVDASPFQSSDAGEKVDQPEEFGQLLEQAGFTRNGGEVSLPAGAAALLLLVPLPLLALMPALALLSLAPAHLLAGSCGCSYRCRPAVAAAAGPLTRVSSPYNPCTGTPQVMISGVTGEPFPVDIYIGVVYYQRLRHMVSDKFQVRLAWVMGGRARRLL